MKTIKTWLTTIVVLLCSIPMNAHDFEVDGIPYLITSSWEHTVMVSRVPEEYQGSIIIPSSVYYNGVDYSVTEIGAWAFLKCSGLTSVTIPNSVTSIGGYAFSSSGLTSVTIPNSVTSIAGSAFSHCTGLTSITLPDGLSTIDRGVFYGCSSLTSITLPDALTTIDEVAFYNCSSLTSINIPSSVTSIGMGAFDGCVMLPTENNIRYADKWAVGVADKSLKTCTLLDNTVAIGGGAFYNCDSLTTIGLPDGLGSIGDKTFYGCTSLASITLPKGLTSIGSSAFEACSSLASITLPNAMTSIGSSAFKDCSALISVTLPDSLNNIGVETFYGCSTLTLISLPSTLNSIGRSAFQECCNLDLVVNYSKLNISKGSESYGYVAYYASRVIDADGNVGDFIFDKMNERYYLTAYIGSDSIVVLPESYKGNKYFIGSSAFENCSGLTSISIPSTVTGISPGAFEDCVKLPTENDVRYADKWAVGVTDKSLTTYTLRDNTVGIADSVFAECTKLSSITLPDVLGSIGIEAFCGCRSLTSIILPNSLTSIGSYAFYDCDNLVEVLNLSDLDISKGSKSHGYVAYYAKRVYNADEMVGDYAFKESIGNNYLVRYVGADSIITLPQDYKGNKYGIDNEAFYGCSRLISVTFPDSLTSIGSYAFYGCRGLTSITFPDGLTSIGNYAFYDCSGLASISLPDSLTSIGSYAFYGCRGLTSITFPDGLTSIGNYAFYDCSGLASISLPDDLSSIGSYAFYDCDNLVEVLNLSDLDISKGSKSHGYVAYYADRVYNADEMVGDYAFKESIGNNYLVRYVGADSIITLPQDYKGNKYGIDNEAFYGCSRLISVTFPDSLTSIGSYAFYGCSGLTSITLPNGLRSIVDKTFYGCSSLTSISIPSSVMSIATDAFDGCVMLPTENSVRYADKWAVGVTDKYRTTYALRENTVGIGGGVFAECAKLSSITLPDVLVSIGVNAFCGCHSLTSITLPKSLTSIGSSAFSRCNNLVEVLNLSDLSISKGSEYHGYVAYYAKRVYNADEMVGDYAFKESDGKNYLVRYVGDDKSITLPENYKDNNYNIGDEAFYGCGFLTSIVIPNSVQVIGNDAFYGCKLSSLTIGTGVRSIGSSSSESNKPKKVFWLPSSCPDGYKNLDGELNYVPNDQYYVSYRKIYPYLSSMFEVNNMKYVPVSPAERTCDLLDCIYDSLGSVVEIEETVSYKGIPMTVQSVGAQTFYGLKNIKEVYVSSSVQKSAFAYCDSLTKVTFGDNAKIIGASAFEGCSSLSDVKIGTNVRSIEDNAFKDCSYLNNIEIADSVENIGVSAFSGCSSLSAIAIPQATGTIKSSAFSGCSSLTNVAIEDRTTNLEFGGDVFNKCPIDSVYIGGKINGTPFSVNKSLRSVAFANNVDSIYAEEFYGCSNLKNVAMGDAVSSIGYQAFSGCSSLESFTFASATKTIGGKAFSGCTCMTSLISLATTPPICGNLALDDIDKWSCVLKVPESSISAYQAADGWKEFFFIESLPTAITEVTEDENLRNATDVYTIGGMKVTSSGKLAKGIYIVDGKKVIVD